MSFKFNLFPTQPQKSYYPKGQRNSTSNSLFQLRENKKQQANQFQLRKDNGLGVIALPGGYKSKIFPKKNSNPRLFKKNGTSKTYNDGTGGRLRRLKARATSKSIPAPPKAYHDFGITAKTNPGGGNIEPTLIGNYTVFKFTEASNLTIPASAAEGTIEYLLVGGGGNGGACSNLTAVAAGGGGGGGSVLINEILQAENGTYTIVVGAPGGSTVMTLPGPTTKTATGGSAPTDIVNNFSNGGNSGSGDSGGNGADIGGARGGGGAGYLTNGGNATPTATPPGVGGAGGAGLDIGALGWEVSSTFVGAGGGGGVSSGTAGAGGSEVGGDGGTNSVGTAAVANSGSGGGGAGASPVVTRNGGAGGSGVVYIRYLSVF